MLAVGALSGVAGCSPAPREPLRIGISARPGHELLYLAGETGMFEREGVAVRVIEFNSPDDARRAFERGQLDGMASTLVEMLQARDHSPRSPQVVAVLDTSLGADALVGHHSIRDVADLRGRAVAVEPGSVGTYLLGRALESVGASLDDVTVVPLDPASVPVAFARRLIDAVVGSPPLTTELEAEFGARCLFTSADVPGELIDVLALDSSIEETRRPESDAVVRAFHRAVAYAAARREEATQIMAARERVAPEVFAAALDGGLRLPSESDQPVLLERDGAAERALHQVDRVLRRAGQIDGPDRTSGAIAAPALKTASAD